MKSMKNGIVQEMTLNRKKKKLKKLAKKMKTTYSVGKKHLIFLIRMTKKNIVFKNWNFRDNIPLMAMDHRRINMLLPCTTLKASCLSLQMKKKKKSH